MDGSGTINPAALNTPGMFFFYCRYPVRANRESRFAVSCHRSRRRHLSLPQRCYIRRWLIPLYMTSCADHCFLSII
jgi:hypothetical protein